MLGKKFRRPPTETWGRIHRAISIAPGIHSIEPLEERRLLAITYFGPPSYPAGNAPDAVVVADLNNDGKLDIVTANFNSGTISVLLGNGNGTFKTQVTYPVGNGPDSVAVADFNGDGIPDLVVANEHSGTVSILLGNGNGTFQKAITYNAGVYPSSVAVGDFNGDTHADIVVVNQYNATEVTYGNTLTVLLGNGNGTFQPIT